VDLRKFECRITGCSDREEEMGRDQSLRGMCDG
jgi:hypothetical protein